MREGTQSSAGAGIMALPPVLVEARDLSLRLRGKTLLSGINLTVREGRVLAIAGANGAGKSLLLRVIHGLLAPTDGRVSWRGAPIDARVRQRQAMVFQRPVMLRRSVHDNITFALAARRLGRRERGEIAERALTLANLRHHRNTPARLLSGGEQQRVALARALACNPELLLLDEPTANLDPASTAAIERLVSEARDRGITVILVSHDRGQIDRLADDLAFLNAGRLCEHGAAQRVLTAPATEPVRAWIEGRLYLSPDAEPSDG